MPLGIVHTVDREAAFVAEDGVELARYVYRPVEAQLESPRPYLHPIRTLGDREVTVFRPWDHVWHKGVTLALPNVGPHNFWGGATYSRAAGGYADLRNNGSQDHAAVIAAEPAGDGVRFAHDLVWRSQAEATGGRSVDVARERREVGAAALRGEAWALTWSSSIVNVSGEPIVLGSPTTEGRENAGYGGLFWRGPRSFTGGLVAGADGTTGEEVRGTRGAWAGFSGRHDGADGASTVVFVDRTPEQGLDTRWFVRADPFACLNPAHFFDRERVWAPDETLDLRYAVVIADGGSEPGRMAELAALVG